MRRRGVDPTRRSVEKGGGSEKERSEEDRTIGYHHLQTGSFADILRRGKTDSELINLRDNVRSIRGSQRGDLLFELRKY